MLGLQNSRNLEQLRQRYYSVERNKEKKENCSRGKTTAQLGNTKMFQSIFTSLINKT